MGYEFVLNRPLLSFVGRAQLPRRNFALDTADDIRYRSADPVLLWDRLSPVWLSLLTGFPPASLLLGVTELLGAARKINAGI